MKVAILLSMLHEPPGRDSVSRQFRGEPVLKWTLRRLAQMQTQADATVICWDDQAAAVRQVIEDRTDVFSAGERKMSQHLESVTAARRWADGWRGGLLATCEFDRGFHGPSADAIRRQKNADAVLLVDPAAGLVDAKLIDELLCHAQSQPDVDLCFSAAAPGLSAVLVRASLLDQVAVGQSHPGVLLHYRPDAPRKDPLSEPACVQIPAKLARTTRRFTLDSGRQIEFLTAATQHLNGELISTDAMGLLDIVERSAPNEELPRELVMELNTHRATDAIYRPGKRLGIKRPPMQVEAARRILSELAEMDDARLVLAGVGDPLLHDNLLEIIQAAKTAGISAVGVETDFVGTSADRVGSLAESQVDWVSVHLPAGNAATYRIVMGGDWFGEVAGNIRLFLERRQAAGRALPLLVPTFIKCKANQLEMEGWYDHWLRNVASAAITGPSDFGGLIPDVAAADMSPPRRGACFSLTRRLQMLCDGTIVSCEQDVLGRQALGKTLKEAWKAAKQMTEAHRAGKWNQYSACAKCREWHRA